MTKPDGKSHQLRRRDLLNSALAATLAGSVQTASAAPAHNLFDKIYGCLAGSFIGSAMGVAVEGFSREKIAEKYGVLKTFEPWDLWWNFPYVAGSTEDGTERVKQMCLAIAEKGDRINAADLARTWARTNPDERMERMKKIVTEFDVETTQVAKVRGYNNQLGVVPAGYIGTVVNYTHGLNTMVRSFMPIAMVNACDEEGAIRDTYDVGRIYHPLTSEGFLWGAAYNAALAHACRPDATVDSVINTALKYAHPSIRPELERGLDIARKYGNTTKMRDAFYEIYDGSGGLPFHYSYAVEIATKAFAAFLATNGNVEDTIIMTVNFGRDTDCLAASAGALAGALAGASKIPPDWIRTVDEATKKNPNTCSQLTIREHAEDI
ncbi:MAG TPA: ADP-ribosylglycohydrolase family protein, partial [Bryobacteraceae bacterium]|nr:ADP-ribosylglycohydrolase family protein [Bryobacteraceae bacterium]